MEKTGFANGLYDDAELDAKNINDKDQKITVLAKMIALVEMVLQEKQECKPTKIVAGLEPERTNEFLQALFRAATSGIDSTPYVRRVLGEDDGGDEEEEEARRQAEEA